MVIISLGDGTGDLSNFRRDNASQQQPGRIENDLGWWNLSIKMGRSELLFLVDYRADGHPRRLDLVVVLDRHQTSDTNRVTALTSIGPKSHGRQPRSDAVRWRLRGSGSRAGAEPQVVLTTRSDFCLGELGGRQPPRDRPPQMPSGKEALGCRPSTCYPRGSCGADTTSRASRA